jgi:hypothetical protein
LFKKKIAISYTARDFNGIKRQLVDYSKKYYPNTQKDFSESGFGSLMFDLVSYVGDVLSYSTDFAANESFLDTALEYDNVIKHGKSRGYKFKGAPSSFGYITAYVIVPADTQGIRPDSNYIPVLTKGSEFANSNGNSFILNENIDFSKSTNEIIVAQVSPTTGIPTAYAIKASGQVISGELINQTITIGDFEQFYRAELDIPNVTEIVSVTDSEGHEYFEVDFLSQNIVYKAIPNFGNDRDVVTSILKPIVVPRRFVVETEKNITYLQFGYGSSEDIKVNPVADPSSTILQLHGKDYYSDTSFDPGKMLETDKFGVAPSNTVLTIVVRVNSSDNTNAAVGTVNSVKSSLFEFNNAATLSPTLMSSVIGSLEVSNDDPIVGDVSLPTTTELKRRIYDTFATQNRAVTREDYISCVYNMPPKFGSIKRASIVQDEDSFKRNLNLYIISENVDGTLTTASDTLKSNLKTWLLNVRMINDTIDILDATVVDLGIQFTAVVDDEQNRFSALSQATFLLAEYYSIPSDIGQNFSISQVYAILKNIASITDVTDVTIVNKSGGVYSDAVIDVDSYTSADGRNLYCPEGYVYQIHFPTSDITGIIK